VIARRRAALEQASQMLAGWQRSADDVKPKKGEALYGHQFVVGIWEYQVNALPELIEDVDAISKKPSM
jgi:hypothetical protein